VDFVIYGEDGLFAIEVKNANHIYPVDLKGLMAFKEDYPEAVCILIYRGHERLQKDGILCIPIEEFLFQLHPDNSLVNE